MATRCSSVGATNTINVTLYEKLNFDFVRDIAPVAGIVRSPLVMEVNASLPVRTVPEFIAYVKANPGKVNMASSGVGATPHMAGELFQYMAGIKMVHVPYRGDAPALADLLGGQVQVYFGGLAAAIDQIKAGKIRALAVSTAARLDVVPDVPAMNEYLPGYEASSWYGMGAPRATLGGDHRAAEQRDQRRPCRPQACGAVGRARPHGASELSLASSVSSSATKPRSGARSCRASGARAD